MKWNFDPAHSNASFSTKHMMVTTVRGTFDEVSGTLEYDPANPSADATVEATIVVNSISTGNNDRDNHLRSADFFNVAEFPEMTFKSTGLKLNADNQSGVLTGDLTISGVTKPVDIDVTFEGHMPNSLFGDERVAFSGSTKINREDYGLTWNQALETGGWLVGKEIKIELDVQAVKVAEGTPA